MIKKSRATFILITALMLSPVLLFSGCAPDPGGDQPRSPEAVQKANDVLREELQELVRMARECDLAEQGIRLELRETEAGPRIYVFGEVENKQSLLLMQMCLAFRSDNPDPPPVFVWRVDIRDEKGKRENIPPADSKLRGKIRAYMSRMTKECDLAGQGIRLEFRETEAGPRIYVLGVVENRRTLQFVELVYEDPKLNPVPPAEFVWQVDIRQK